jgi:hypothetical protein
MNTFHVQLAPIFLGAQFPKRLAPGARPVQENSLPDATLFVRRDRGSLQIPVRAATSLRGLPLSRLSLSEIRREVITQGLVAEISGATLWRWLSADALRPWRHRSWIFPRDPDFAAKAGRILDLYDRIWLGRPLNAREFVISADEKSSIQARRRKQPTLAPAPGRSEHEVVEME